MLERLIIENVALIERLDLELLPGLNVLTGETGAGKSIIIDAVNLVLGGRGSRELIAYGKPKARVEAFFSLNSDSPVAQKLAEASLESDDGSLTLVREISASGKSICRINGELVQLAALRSITEMLVDVHGQHEHQSLLDEKNHLAVIDAYGAADIAPLAAEVNTIYSEYAAAVSKLNSGFMTESERERRIDVLNYQINEIDKARLLPSEEEDIKAELALLTNSEHITESLNRCSELLSGDVGAIGAVRSAVRALNDISVFSEQYQEAYSRLNDLYYELEDVGYTVRDMRLSSEYDPKRLNALETRLDIINALKHKYGASIAKVLEFSQNAKSELAELLGNAKQRELLTHQRDDAKKRYYVAAERLTNARKRHASTLCRLALLQLNALGMKNAALEAEFSVVDAEPHMGGADDVALLLSANAGEPPKPLSKIASGGELSRIMLALKTVITEADGIPTLVFDEVDSGISGATANIVGQRMKTIAQNHQVLCVTHLPQIAAFANVHYLVEKHERDGRTATTVKQLSETERQTELARIMGADGGSVAALSHAAELMEKAKSKTAYNA